MPLNPHKNLHTNKLSAAGLLKVICMDTTAAAAAAAAGPSRVSVVMCTAPTPTCWMTISA